MENQSSLKLDTKDYEILRELDINFRQNFSKIGKKVKLSKNSVSLRFEKLKKYMLHNLVGINNKRLGFTEIRVYYSFDFYNEETEKAIIKELKKSKNVIWAARFYGPYDLGVCFLIKNLQDFIEQFSKFNERFSSKINQKHTQIICRSFYFRYNFIHEKPVKEIYSIENTSEKIKLNKADKKILKIIAHHPRMNIVTISDKTRLSLKTIATRLKELEKNKVIMGYFMTLDTAKFNHTPFILFIQVKNLKKEKEFEEYLSQNKNIKILMRMSGVWDYELNFIYPSIRELQQEIEDIKEKFPNVLKKFEIMSFGKRIYTNKDNLPI